MAGQESFFLYKKAVIEGYLDKINTGITSRWMSGKTRMWCELYGTLLYTFKDSKRSSAGSHQIDMSQVHMVRKITNDKSGFQFEVLSKNKQHTFCASSVAECDNWIRHLQAAMTLKGQESPPLAEKSTVSVGDYETIVLPEDKPTTPGIKIGATSTTDPGYSEVEIRSPQPPPSPKTSSAAGAVSPQGAESEGDDGYSTVEFRKSQPVVQPSQKSRDSDLPPTSPAPPPASPPPADRPVVEEDRFGYAKVEMRKKSFSELPPPCQTASRPEAESKGEGDSYTYATVQRATVPGTVADKPENSVHTPVDGVCQESSDEDDSLIDRAQSKPDPIPPFPHPLQSADVEPLADLQEFLSTNRKLCRPSFSDRMMTENPVGDMKRLLEDLRL